ncbi:S8 family peptidase [Deinococcus radiodurans]|jgi:Subtilisin-like serine proteases|uniref:S8 family peptidase n=1 Tax=Deinococcus radiodurans TaxID=1299 RepID=UPI000481BEF0|nr:S8 family peptidase [Deinococcus radiodurans]ANC70624.1 peptidase S8 [Deinococcus radiodurans R1 = ATCC 13939 = DSM 20539]QEM71702.1 S8 family peptidase [Deinococcus radiodurans]QIP27992.1 S8 family peptidase [Deinococcus radiodurans]QIP31126.1 S8 family peptidase [Deinococcus radiodurans]UDL01344.1 S8 family peptidase [Deinococcus radiodurans R1 = ATCC 13939 = DSM 20539]
MNARLVAGALTLTLILASCGSQQSTPAASAQPDTAAQRTRTLAPLLGTDKPDAIAGQYIVVFSEGASSGSLSAQDTGSGRLSSLSAGQLVRALNLDPQGVTVQNIYNQALEGFSGKLSAQNLQTLRADHRVKYIEQDGMMYASATQSGATWGIDRIDQRSLPLDSSYTYGTTGSGVKAYIIDTGINTSHTAFGGRAVWGTNQSGDGNDSDCNGHGTHVAGTVGSSTYGVAKGVSLIAVKVLACDGSGSNSGVIAGINWAVGNKGSAAAVANMSLGGGASQAVDDAVNNAASKNLVMAVAAGNENQNACNVSPARAVNAITVGATTKTDSRDTGYSNYGSCLDIFAPGTNITSTWIGSTSATNTISGTSMATPHVTGAVALLIAEGNTTTSAVTSALLNNATTGKLSSIGTGSPNRLLYTGSGATTPAPTPTPAPGTTTTYSGSVSRGGSSYKPGSSGFSYAGGTLSAQLSGPGGTDFDLYLQKYNGSTWADVAASEASGSSETISYNAGAGTYRWEVYAYSGSGSYSLTETK